MVHSSPRELTEAKRFAIFCDLKAGWNGTKLKHGIKTIIAKRYKVSRWTVDDLWQRGMSGSEPEKVWNNLKSKKKRSCRPQKTGYGKCDIDSARTADS